MQPSMSLQEPRPLAQSRGSAHGALMGSTGNLSASLAIRRCALRMGCMVFGHAAHAPLQPVPRIAPVQHSSRPRLLPSCFLLLFLTLPMLMWVSTRPSAGPGAPGNCRTGSRRSRSRGRPVPCCLSTRSSARRAPGCLPPPAACAAACQAGQTTTSTGGCVFFLLKIQNLLRMHQLYPGSHPWIICT